MKVSIEDLGVGRLGLSTELQTALEAGQFHGLAVWTQCPEQAPVPDRWSEETRQNLAQALRAGLAQNAASPGHAGAQRSLELLEQAGTLAVTTGQQPGFLCSPLYSLIKAAQCCQLAKELSALWKQPVVPLFWNHADDHDIAEVHHAYIQNRNLDLQKVSLSGLSSGRQPLSRIPLTRDEQGIDAIEALLRENFAMYPFCDAALELFLPQEGETLPQAMTRAFHALLGEHGLVVVEPDWIRAPLSDALADMIAADPRAALTRGADLGSIDARTAALLFRLNADGRLAWRMHPDGFIEDQTETVYSPRELADQIRAHPGDWSAGALLRPLVQDLALPNAAYIGGFGELRYHGQLMPMREELSLPKTGFVPRVSMTIVDEETRASLDKSGFTVVDVLDAKGRLTLEETAAADPPVLDAIRQIVSEAQTQLRAQLSELAKIEPSLDSGLRRAADQMGQGIEKLLGKAQRIHQNKGGKVGRHLRRLNHRLMPREIPQERVLGPFEFYSRMGPDWMQALYAVTPGVNATHLVLSFE